MYYNDRGRLIALLPANCDGEALYSHQGLTYGGMVLSAKSTAAEVLELFDVTKKHLRGQRISRVTYKSKPYIYNSMPAEEDLYALFLQGARLTARSISSTILLGNRPKWRQNRRTALNKALSSGVTVRETDDLEGFWHILEDNLMQSHGARPVHTVEEMKLLKSRFPENIRLLVAFSSEGDMIGGALLYLCGRVIHTQYISATKEGKRLGAIDAVIRKAITFDAVYFDFGTSTENNGQHLNASLIFQKEGFGARGVCYDTYEWIL